MPNRIIAVAVDCRDTAVLAEFWCAALDYRVLKRWQDSCGVEYLEVGTGERTRPGEPMLLFQPVPEGKTGKNRLHLDLRAGPDGQQAEVRRLQKLGARVLSDDPAHPWIVLADPEDNEFCVLPAG